MIQATHPRTSTRTSKKLTQNHFRVTEQDLPEFSFSASLIADVDELEQLKIPWERLVETSLKTNPFFDPDFLIPAVRHLGNGKVKVLVVKSKPRVNPNGQDVICALLPLRKRRFYGMPLSCLEIWKHDQCFDCTPLVRHDCASEALEFIFTFLGNEHRTSLLSLDTVAGDGDFANLLTDNFHSNTRAVFYRDQFTRACFKPAADAETYVNTNVSKSTRKGTQRLRRKLSSQGNLETTVTTCQDTYLVDEFLRLEALGWKGKSGTAIASDPGSTKFFREIAERMLPQNKLTIATTMLNGRAIAIACDLKQGDKAAHFKITFDESLQEFSPGLILELDNIKRLHASNISFVDSCADPDHKMINRVWSDRTRFQNLVVSLRGQTSSFAVSAMPMIQHVSKLLKGSTK